MNETISQMIAEYVERDNEQLLLTTEIEQLNELQEQHDLLYDLLRDLRNKIAKEIVKTLGLDQGRYIHPLTDNAVLEIQVNTRHDPDAGNITTIHGVGLRLVVVEVEEESHD